MLDQGRNICGATRLPVIGDGDTGYGNALNVKRTVRSYASAGFGGVMIEDQEAPKRCGHTRGKRVVSRAEALSRVGAAVHARDERIGYKIAAYPLTLLSAATAAMLDALRTLGNSERPDRNLDFEHLREILGFDDYDAEAERYRIEDEGER